MKATPRVIAIEEHFWSANIRRNYPASYPLPKPDIARKLGDLGSERLRDMDAARIDLQVISHTAPGIEQFETETAIMLAREANDVLAEAVRAHPSRFAGFATLPVQAPEAAADELERSVKELGFKGAMINGHTRGDYLDEVKYRAIFERAQSLEVPIYLHPTNPPQAVYDTYYRDYPRPLIPSWGFNVETGTHAIRLILSGLFDDLPRLKIILGHMGEMMPFQLWRLEHWLTPEVTRLKRTITEYFLENFVITTSGMFSYPPLMCALAVVGADNILFSADYPYEDNREARRFLDNAPIGEIDRRKLAHG